MPANKTASLNFSHAPETIEFWKRLVREALSFSGETPFYLFSALPISEIFSAIGSAEKR